MAQNEDPNQNQALATPANDNPETPNTASDVNPNVPDDVKDTPLSETFLPESAEEREDRPNMNGEEDPNNPADPNADPNQAPNSPTTPAPGQEEENQPNNTQNAEVVDKTKETPLLAGKYKTVDELKHGIEEIGGDPSLAGDDPKALEAIYLVSQKAFTKWNQTHAKPETPATPAVEEPKPFEINDDFVEGLMNQLDYEHINDSTDLVRQVFTIFGKAIQQNLPNMLPKQAPAQPTMTPEEMAAQVHHIETATDALGYIEAKVPRLGTDKNFRDMFGRHIADGKKSGKYPTTMTRETMTQAMKDFQQGLRDMAGVPAQDPQNQEDKGGAAVPDGGGSSSTDAPANPEDDILGGIVGAKAERDAKFA